MSSSATTGVRWLWTWGGAPFGYREGDDLRTHDGRHVACFEREEIFAADGRYLGELMAESRLITAKFRRGARRAAFIPKPRNPRLPPRASIAGYAMPTGYEDFPGPENVP